MSTPLKKDKTSLVPIIAASSVGTLIEWYDFYVFGSMASIISTQFFPKENATAAFLATLATFSAGFVVRPFGALFFGRLGDVVGRKYTFMITLIMMGGSTFAIGLVPKYESIGFWAPLIVLILRLMQGLAIGGEYGGAATFVAEHAPLKRRGFFTSWIQITAMFGFAISLGVILITKTTLGNDAWENWAWRIPFLVSAVMVAVSVWMRRNMDESPLFTQAKAEGKTSLNPLKESFGKKQNLKVVLLALFGLTMGVGVMGWSSIFYVQSFLIKFMNIDYDQTNSLLMISIFIGVWMNVVFGKLSDKVGRKNLLMLSLLLAVICFRPLFSAMFNTTILENKTELLDKKTTEIKIEPETNNLQDSTRITKISQYYTDGTSCQTISRATVSAGRTVIESTNSVISINNTTKAKLVVIILILMIIGAMSYGPLAAYLVEMFPVHIRYTSLSLPYHIGYGILGGMSPIIATYMIEAAKQANQPTFYLQGLTYPIILMSISFVIGVIYLKDGTAKPLFVLPEKTAIKLKTLLGIVWIILAGIVAYFGIVYLGIPKLTSGIQDDVIFGVIVMFFITPVATLGLFMFGKYCLSGAYND